MKAFSLIEVMVAITILVLVVGGALSVFLKSYRLSNVSRYRDNGRAILLALADQFQRLSTTDKVGNNTATRWLFTPTTGETGAGLRWGKLCDESTASTASTPVSGLVVTLGPDGAQISATVTREVSYVDATTGDVLTSQDIGAAGYMLRAIFHIRYKVNGDAYEDTLSAARAIP